MAIPVIGLGAGGHSKVVIEVMRLDGRYELIGLLDPKFGQGAWEVLGVPVIGTDAYLEELKAQGVTRFFIGLGSSGNMTPRKRLYELARALDMIAVEAVHPRAVVSAKAIIGQGVTIAANAVINPGAQLGENVLINTAAVVEHDCLLGDHVHIATGALLTGNVIVGDGAHIGAGATIRQGIKVGTQAIVGAGAVVIKDVPPGIVVAGVPAKTLSTSRLQSTR